MPRRRHSFRKHSRRQRGGKRRRRRLQRGGLAPFIIPLIAAGITAAGGIGASAAHAAISRQ